MKTKIRIFGWVVSFALIIVLLSFALIIILSIFAYRTTSNASFEYNALIDVPASIKTYPNMKIPKQTKEVSLLSAYIKERKSNSPIELCDKIAYEIINQSRVNNIPDEIIVGIIEIESMWDIYARSEKNAKGLMQILLEDGVEIDPDRSFDIQYNIEKGIEIFKSKMRKSKGDVSLALEYYVGGDKKYHKEVYKYLGKYILYKINCSNKEVSKSINIVGAG